MPSLVQRTNPIIYIQRFKHFQFLSFEVRKLVYLHSAETEASQDVSQSVNSLKRFNSTLSSWPKQTELGYPLEEVRWDLKRVEDSRRMKPNDTHNALVIGRRSATLIDATTTNRAGIEIAADENHPLHNWQDGWDEDAALDVIQPPVVPDVKLRKIFVKPLQLYKPIKQLNARELVDALAQASRDVPTEDIELWSGLAKRAEHISHSLDAKQLLYIIQKLHSVNFTPIPLYKKLSEECLPYLPVYSIEELSQLAEVYSSPLTRNLGLLNVLGYIFCQRTKETEAPISAAITYLRAFSNARHYQKVLIIRILQILYKQLDVCHADSLLHILSSLSQFPKLLEAEEAFIASVFDSLASGSSAAIGSTETANSNTKLDTLPLHRLLQLSNVVSTLPKETFTANLCKARDQFNDICIRAIACKIALQSIALEELSVLIVFLDYSKINSNTFPLILPAYGQPCRLGRHDCKEVLKASQIYKASSKILPSEHAAQLMDSFSFRKVQELSLLNTKSDIQSYKAFCDPSNGSLLSLSGFPLRYVDFLTPLKEYSEVQFREIMAVDIPMQTVMELLKTMSCSNSVYGGGTYDMHSLKLSLIAFLTTKIAIKSNCESCESHREIVSLLTMFSDIPDGTLPLSTHLFLVYSNVLMSFRRFSLPSQRLLDVLPLLLHDAPKFYKISRWNAKRKEQQEAFYDDFTYQRLHHWAVVRWLYSLLDVTSQATIFLLEQHDKTTHKDLVTSAALCTWINETTAIISTSDRLLKAEVMEFLKSFQKSITDLLDQITRFIEAVSTIKHNKP